ncbi:hypothetical protein B0H14DRAFT_3158904 [Mycena olivaceomarginata]|nr:hypothetical protein B0H14DRAFT_3158904 [Mycena olivaceomarginata]
MAKSSLNQNIGLKTRTTHSAYKRPRHHGAESESQVNKKGCEHIAKRSAQLVQDIWRQTKDFGVVLPEEVERSVVDIENLFKEIESFFGGLETEKAWKRFARQDVHKSQVAEYGRLLDEAMMQFSFNLELSIPRLHMESAAADEKRHAAVHRLHMESAAADEKRHAAVLTVSQMSESERLIMLLSPRPNRSEKIFGCGTSKIHPNSPAENNVSRKESWGVRSAPKNDELGPSSLFPQLFDGIWLYHRKEHFYKRD